MADEKNMIASPVAPTVNGFVLNGIPLAVVMDMRESGGFLQIVEGANPMKHPTPSIEVRRGAMLVLLPDEVAEKVRPQLKEVERKQAMGIGEGRVGYPIGPDLTPQ